VKHVVFEILEFFISWYQGVPEWRNRKLVTLFEGGVDG